MIIITNPPTVTKKLGSVAPEDLVACDKLVVSPVSLNVVDQTIAGTLRITSSTIPIVQPITGNLQVNVPAATLRIEIPQLDFYRTVTLDSASNTAVLKIISDAQDAIENGLVAMGLIAGTQSAGA